MIQVTVVNDECIELIAVFKASHAPEETAYGIKESANALTMTKAIGFKAGRQALSMVTSRVGVSTRNNLKLIAVIMKAPTTKLRFGEAKQLLDFGFNNYEYVDMGKKNDVIQNVEIEKSTENSVNLVYENEKRAQK